MIIENITIEKVVNKGLGLCYSEGKPIFVFNALPGDVVDLEILKSNSKYLLANVVRYKAKSKYHIDPLCDVFGICGGCDWLNAQYQYQLDFKTELIKEAFSQIGQIPDILPTIGSACPYNYRNKVFLPVSLKNQQPIYGVYAKRTHEVIAHKKCILQPDLCQNVANRILEYVSESRIQVYREDGHRGNLRHIGIRLNRDLSELIVILVTKTRKLPFSNILVESLKKSFPELVGVIQNINPWQTNRITGDETKIHYGKDYLNDQIGKFSFRVNYLSFFQVNPFTTESLYQAISEQVEKNEKVIDAFSGILSIGTYISSKAQEVVGIEANPPSCRDAEINIKMNNLNNCSMIEGKVEDVLPELVKKRSFHTIIFDPPRKGLEYSTISAVIESGIKKIIYVSCNHVTQLRDIKLFTNLGYKIEKIQPFDMFPHTSHIENLVILNKH